MGVKLIKVDNSKRRDNASDYIFECPGCGHAHGLYVTHPNDVGAKWVWNEDIEKPTVQPSINSRWQQGGKQQVCHFFVREGKIVFLGDCTHDLKGKTVDMIDV